MNINKAIKDLKTLLPSSTNKYRPYADQVLNLFKDRKIEKRIEAEKLLEQLSSRGKAPQAAITKITEKYSKQESATGKLERRELKTYFVSGTFHSIDTYKQKITKAGKLTNALILLIPLMQHKLKQGMKQKQKKNSKSKQ
jgi:hypothetical protein